MIFSFSTLLIGMLLVLLQLLAAVPWLFAALAPRDVMVLGLRGFVRKLLSQSAGRQIVLYSVAGSLLFCIAFPVIFFSLTRDKDAVENWGRFYAFVLQFQLTIDCFVLLFPLVLVLWPKGGAVAQAAFREGVRQPMFWLLFTLAAVALFIAPWWQYFTFGEDYVMVKELGYDTIVMFAIVFGVLAANLSVREEIEGRTAITLMSKPVSRRQFLLGKFAGILLITLLMIALLGEHFEATLVLKRYLDKMDTLPTPGWVGARLVNDGLPDIINDFLRGAGTWAGLTLETLPGLVLSFCQVMVLVSIAVALATRVPMVVNLVFVGVVYLVANLTPALLAKGRKAEELFPGSIVAQMLSFVAKVFDTLLPGLDFLRVGPALVSDTPLPAWPFFLYILSVAVYALLYTLIVILIGLVLFEDRDLA